MPNEIRSPICSVMGHVDHGKSSILDYIRHTNIVAREAGAITQAIGASIVPADTLKKIIKGTLKNVTDDHFKLPGLLFIDTPGHAAFTNLRKRGGNLADIAILMVDIREGLMPQTIEAIQILKQYKTPFVIVANKIDLLQGYRSAPKTPVLSNVATFDSKFKLMFDTKIYELVGKMHEHGFNADRFDRIQDYTQQIAIIPASAMLGDGIPEVLMVLSGLAQKFLEKTLHFDLNAPAKGTILEVKDEQGIGTAVDAIIFDGKIRAGDSVVVGTMGEPITTKVRALFEPAPHAEMMDKKSKYKTVKEVVAATGVRIAGPGLDAAVAGMPIMVCTPETEKAIKAQIAADVNEVMVDNDEDGIIVKADSLGSLEAVVRLVREGGFAVRKATVGEIGRRDLADAESNIEENPLDAVVLGFNLKEFDGGDKVKVFISPVIYTLIENFKTWRIAQQKVLELKKLEHLNRPAKLEYLQNHTFRQSNPAIVGLEVLGGTLKSGSKLMNIQGKVVGTVKQIQKDNKSATQAEFKDQVAVSIEGATAGRQIEEGEIFYTAISSDEFRKFKEVKDILEGHEKSVLKEIADIMRENNPVWGV
jgi:translation initiation factor 5B